MSNVPFAASNTRFVQVAPAQDLMRAIVSPFGAMTKTWPREACATKSRPFLSIVSPSGPLVPRNKLNRPTFPTRRHASAARARCCCRASLRRTTRPRRD